MNPVLTEAPSYRPRSRNTLNSVCCPGSDCTTALIIVPASTAHMESKASAGRNHDQGLAVQPHQRFVAVAHRLERHVGFGIFTTGVRTPGRSYGSLVCTTKEDIGANNRRGESGQVGDQPPGNGVADPLDADGAEIDGENIERGLGTALNNTCKTTGE